MAWRPTDVTAAGAGAGLRTEAGRGPSRHLAAAGLIAGNMLRRVAWTSRDTLPRCRRLTRAEVLTEVPEACAKPRFSQVSSQVRPDFGHDLALIISACC